MSSFEKYRIHEVAKDFGMASKVITEILTEYATVPKNHMQVLETAELDLIFEYLTQRNQVRDISEIFAVSAPEPPKTEAPAPKQQQDTPAPAKPVPAQQSAGTPPQKKQEKPSKPHTPKPVAEKRIIDTRGSSSTTTNLNKYDEKFDKLAGDRGDKQRGGKEKINRPDSPAAAERAGLQQAQAGGTPEDAEAASGNR